LPSRGEEGGTPGSRNHLVVLSGDVIVALPGGAGTASELRLAREYARPVILLGWERRDPVTNGSTRSPASSGGPRSLSRPEALGGSSARPDPEWCEAADADALSNLLDNLLRPT